MKGKTIVLWAFQLTTAAILFIASYGKLTSQPGAVMLFTELGMEPTGRYLIGIIEGFSALLLITNRAAATGALLSVGTMLGALIAHVTVLGFNVMGDHGKHVLLLCIVLTFSLVVAILRRQQLPLIGNSFS